MSVDAVSLKKKKEMKQALDESEKRTLAVEGELVFEQKTAEEVAKRLEAGRVVCEAAQALEAKQIADARQKELKQALDESEKRSEALTRELASVRGNDVAARNQIGRASCRERE